MCCALVLVTRTSCAESATHTQCFVFSLAVLLVKTTLSIVCLFMLKASTDEICLSIRIKESSSGKNACLQGSLRWRSLSFQGTARASSIRGWHEWVCVARNTHFLFFCISSMRVCGLPSALKHPATDTERLSVNEQAALRKRNSVVPRKFLNTGTEYFALACPDVDEWSGEPLSKPFGSRVSGTKST